MEEQMNFHMAMKKYKDEDFVSRLESGSKHDFIKIILTELHTNLGILSHCIKNEPKTSPLKSKSFGRSITALTILMNSLDFENGEPIASNLFNLYDYCNKSVLKDYRNLETKGIESSKEVIDEILDAWKQIK